jgi:DNA-binding NtrC family response regulator
MRDSTPMLMGTSQAIRTLRQAVAVASASDAKVLITGDTGTGKEVVAHLIHAHSARAQRELIALNCAGIPDTLLESELFGHERGSFTGAERNRDGILKKAHGGTVLLDEIGETSLRMQAVLLRFLDSGEIQRVGGTSKTCVDVRLIAATNRDLARGVAAKEFRLDLFYRLNVLHLRTTALCERREDIPILVAHFLALCSRGYRLPLPTLTAGAMDALVQYGWPGNVRELKNVAERLVVRRAGETVEAADVSREIGPSIHRPGPQRPMPSSGADDGRATDLYGRLTAGRESFKSVVQEPYMAHDLTRDDVRSVVSRGLRETQGNYVALAQLFSMDARACTWTMKFVHKHDPGTVLTRSALRGRA